MIDKQLSEKLLCQSCSEDGAEKVLQKSREQHVPEQLRVSASLQLELSEDHSEILTLMSAIIKAE